MAYYIKKEDQDRIVELMQEYIEISNCGEIQTHKSNLIMAEFFKYVDTIINGVIHMPKYRFYTYAELDDLIQEGRSAIISSVHKQQWKAERGNVFNFFTTVIIRNLINFTTKHNKKQEIDTDIDTLYNNSDLTYEFNYSDKYVIESIFKSLKQFFDGKAKFVELTELLEHYYYDNLGKRFVKKHFIEFAKMKNFSPAITNTYFAYTKRAKIQSKTIKELLEK